MKNAKDCKTSAPRIEPVNIGDHGSTVPRMCPLPGRSETQKLTAASEMPDTAAASSASTGDSKPDSQSVPSGSGRDESGRFTQGNTISTLHGLYKTGMAEVLLEQRQAFFEQSIQDDGGASEVPTRRKSLHVYRSRLHIHISQLSDAIEKFGLFDRRGRLRGAWLSRLESLVGRAVSIDATLGLQRRSRTLPSARELIAEHDDRQREVTR